MGHIMMNVLDSPKVIDLIKPIFKNEDQNSPSSSTSFSSYHLPLKASSPLQANLPDSCDFIGPKSLLSTNKSPSFSQLNMESRELEVCIYIINLITS